MAINRKISDTSARLGLVRFSYVHVFETNKRAPDGTPKYSCVCLIPKKDLATVALFNECYEAARELGKVTKWGGKVPAKLASPLRDGDEETDDENYAGMWFFNCSSPEKSQPGVQVLEDGIRSEATGDKDFYSGCWGAVTVRLFPYDAAGNKGVGVGLNNVIKLKDDTRLSGGRSADEDFSDLDDLDI